MFRHVRLCLNALYKPQRRKFPKKSPWISVVSAAALMPDKQDRANRMAAVDPYGRAYLHAERRPASALVRATTIHPATHELIIEGSGVKNLVFLITLGGPTAGLPIRRLAPRRSGRVA